MKIRILVIDRCSAKGRFIKLQLSHNLPSRFLVMSQIVTWFKHKWVLWYFSKEEEETWV